MQNYQGYRENSDMKTMQGQIDRSGLPSCLMRGPFGSSNNGQEVPESGGMYFQYLTFIGSIFLPFAKAPDSYIN